MVRISVPVRGGVEAEAAFRFRVQPLGVLLAGSRSGMLPEALCRQVVRRLCGEGFSFFVGCATGVDRSFRQALAREHLAGKSFVTCASRERLRRSCGLFASVVVPAGLSMRAALHRRTVWMVHGRRMAGARSGAGGSLSRESVRFGAGMVGGSTPVPADRSCEQEC
jgi:hypothetical protein